MFIQVPEKSGFHTESEDSVENGSPTVHGGKDSVNCGGIDGCIKRSKNKIQ